MIMECIGTDVTKELIREISRKRIARNVGLTISAINAWTQRGMPIRYALLFKTIYPHLLTWGDYPEVYKRLEEFEGK